MWFGGYGKLSIWFWVNCGDWRLRNWKVRHLPGNPGVIPAAGARILECPQAIADGEDLYDAQPVTKVRRAAAAEDPLNADLEEGVTSDGNPR
jgi:hypothetical protein